MSFILELPPSIEQQLAPKEQLPRFVLEAVALEGYRQTRLSAGQVGTLLGMGVMQTEAFLQERGAYLTYSVADAEADLQALRNLTAGRSSS